MSLQPGSAYVNYLAVKKLLPLDEQANQYSSTTIFAVDSSGALAGYDPATWFSTIGMPNPSTLQSEIVSTLGVIDYGLSSTLYGLVSTSQIVNQYILASSLSSTVAGLATTTGVSQAQLDNRIKNLAAEGYVSSTQLASTVAGLGTAGYLSTTADGTLHVKALSTGSVSLSTLALIDITTPTSKKLLYNSGGGLYFGGTLLGGEITDLSLNTLDVSNATVYADLTVGGSITAPITYSETLSTLVVNAQKNPADRTWAVAGYFPSEGDYGVQLSSNNGASWDLSGHLFVNKINNIQYFNGIWFALGQGSTLSSRGILYSVNNGLSWEDVNGPTGSNSFNSSDLYGIAYNGSSYLLVGQKSLTERVWSSTDGITWVFNTNIANMTSVFNVSFNGTYWVICGEGSSPIQYSVDGINWSAASGLTTQNFKNIVYNGHTMVVIENVGTPRIYYSINKGVSWNLVPFIANGTALSWNGSYFIAATNSPALYYSRDGISWTQSPTNLSESETVTSIFWNGRTSYGISANYIYKSTDGITWTVTPIPITYSIDYAVAISYSLYVGDDIIGENVRYYGVDIPHYYDSTNQLYAGPDSLLLNNTLTVKDGFVGIMKSDPTVHLDVEGAARASTISVSTLQLADVLGQTVLTGNKGMLLVNNIPIVQSTVTGLGQTYISIPSLTSTVQGLGTTGYVSSLSLASTVTGLGTVGYVSSLSLASTVQGLGTAGYVSSLSLASTVQGLGTVGYVSSLSLASTVQGLGTTGYVSSLSLASTVQGLGTVGYISSLSLASTVQGLGTAGYVSSLSLASTVQGLGSARYVSSLSLASTVRGLGSAGYVSSLSLASTVGSLLTNLQVSSFAASTITFAKLFTSTIYMGNDNASTNMIRFYGTAGDGTEQANFKYAHTVIAERVYDEPTKSELLLFKGNDGITSLSGPDRIRHLAGAHQFDIIRSGGASKIWYDGSGNPPPPDISGLLYMDGSGNGRIGINTTNPQALLDISGAVDAGYAGLNTNGTITIANNGQNHKIRLVTTAAASYIQSDISGRIEEGQSVGTAIGNNLHFSRWNGSGIAMTVDTSGGRVGIGTTTPSYSLDVSGSFYASTINYAKLYTSTVYVGNANMSTNMIRFYGTNLDNQTEDGGIYSHTVIAERIYEADEKSELLLFKGNDRNTGDLDRIRHLAGAHQFDIISQPSSWPDTSGNPPAAGISAALYVDSTGKVGVGTTSPGASLDVSGIITAGFGTVGAPSYSFGSDTNTGIYRPGADTLGFVTNGVEQIRVVPSGNVGIGTTTPSYNLDVSGSFYASTINYAKLYTSTVYVGNDNLSTNLIRFYGTRLDGPQEVFGPYSHTVIAERIYEAPQKSELLFFKGNDPSVSLAGPDRIRHLAGAHQFDIIGGSSVAYWPDTSGNPPDAGISAALYVDNTGKVGVGTTSPGASLDVSGAFTSRLKFVDVSSGTSITIGSTHYGAYVYVTVNLSSGITFPTGGSVPPDGTVVVIINDSGSATGTLTNVSKGNTTVISDDTTRTFAYHTGPGWIGL